MRRVVTLLLQIAGGVQVIVGIYRSDVQLQQLGWLMFVAGLIQESMVESKR